MSTSRPAVRPIMSAPTPRAGSSGSAVSTGSSPPRRRPPRAGRCRAWSRPGGGAVRPAGGGGRWLLVRAGFGRRARWARLVPAAAGQPGRGQGGGERVVGGHACSRRARGAGAGGRHARCLPPAAAPRRAGGAARRLPSRERRLAVLKTVEIRGVVKTETRRPQNGDSPSENGDSPGVDSADSPGGSRASL